MTASRAPVTSADRRIGLQSVSIGCAVIYLALVTTAERRTMASLAQASSVTRNEESVSASPRTHEFAGGPYRNRMSAAFPPVLRVNSGDSVRTSTLDNVGVDAAGALRASPPNPQTGPFFVDGAAAGDTLAVTLDAVSLNRDSAHSIGRLVPYTVTADYALRTEYGAFDANWALDHEQGVAVLRHPSPGLKDFRVKVRPMLGGIGVAAPRDPAPLATELGAWGGNLDYASLAQGTTVYLPVFHPGALLYIGDGHAFQGDGELTGAAIETSLDVRFTVRVLKGWPLDGPRAENDEFLMAMGIGDTFSEAFRRSTSSLLTWLQRDYSLSPNEAAMVLGAILKYDVAEIVDPQIHVVARLAKAALPARTRSGVVR